MASDSNILREYLISIGFKVGDGATKLDKQLAGWDKAATKLTKSLVGVGTAVAGMVQVFAYQMDKLYYASQRTGAAVSNIKALDYAGTRIGLGAGTMQAAIENMAKTIRANPAMIGFIEGMTGVKVAGRDPALAMKDVLKSLAKMPTWLGAQIGEQMGISEEVLTQFRLNQGEMEASAARYGEIMRSLGVDQNQATKDAHEYMQEWREIGVYAEGFVAVLAKAMLPAMHELAGVAKEVLTTWSAIVTKYSAPTGGGLGGFFNDLRDGLRAYMGLAPLSFGNVAGQNDAQRHRLQVARNQGLIPQATVPGSGGGSFSLRNLGPSDAPVGGPDTLGLRQHNPGNLRPGGGWSSTNANGFESFADDASGLSAMAGQLLVYQARGLDTLKSIISTWAPASDNNDPAGYAALVAKRMGGIGTDEHLDLNNPETLTKLMAAMVTQEQGRNPFSQSTLETAAASRGVTIQQKTDIHVSGAGNPRQVADAVADSQRDVNQDLVRNNRGAVR